VSKFRARYGEHPLHLVAHLLGFAIAGYAIVQLLAQKHWVNWAVWFLAAALLHDIVLLPLYSLLDRIGHRVTTPVHVHVGGNPDDPTRVPRVNHIRAPALISGVLLLIYFPLILGPADAGYFSATGHHPSGYLRNWLLITVALFAGSALIYAVRVGARRSRR
jgi:MFS family permease